MAVLLHDRSETAGQKQREALRLPRTSAVVALFAFSSRMDRDSMRLFARTHGDEVRTADFACAAAARKTACSPTGSCLRGCSRSCAADWNRLYKTDCIN